MEQIIDMRTTLRYLGVTILGPSQIFGNNESIVNICMKFHSKLNKRYNELSVHPDICRIHHIYSEDNPADILSKHWSYNCA